LIDWYGSTRVRLDHLIILQVFLHLPTYWLQVSIPTPSTSFKSCFKFTNFFSYIKLIFFVHPCFFFEWLMSWGIKAIFLPCRDILIKAVNFSLYSPSTMFLAYNKFFPQHFNVDPCILYYLHLYRHLRCTLF